MKQKRYSAVFLSLIPGLGQLHIGKTAKGLALLCITLGLLMTAVLSKSLMLRLVVLVTYLALMVPAAIEAYLIAKTGVSKLDLDHPGYIVMMLLLTGMSALPLLWQSRRFSRASKLCWTGTVILLGVLFIGGLALYWKNLDAWLKTIFHFK